MQVDEFKEEYDLTLENIALMLGFDKKQVIHERKKAGWQIEYISNNTQVRWTKPNGRTVIEDVI